MECEVISRNSKRLAELASRLVCMKASVKMRRGADFCQPVEEIKRETAAVLENTLAHCTAQQPAAQQPGFAQLSSYHTPSSPATHFPTMNALEPIYRVILDD